MGLLDGKVAIITGAGGGLGREYALLFAQEGAKVVVNDLGGDRHGSGGGSAMSQQVVEEIKAAGGEAIADGHNVVNEGDAIIATATDAYGRVDILVNNAGILRDKSLLKIDDDMWDSVIAVHLRGTFQCTRAAARVMKMQGSGVILNTSSFSGLIGNFGQANYGAAKAGIAGFTRVCAKELTRYGVRVNCIAPMAKTRMTEDIDMVSEEITPDLIAPVALWLCSDESKDINGQVFGAHGPQVFEYRMIPTDGVKLDGKWTPALLSEKLSEISALPGASAAPAESSGSQEDIIDEVFSRMPEAFLPEKAGDFAAMIHFVLGDAGTWSVDIKNGGCEGMSGAQGSPDCTLTFDAAETFLGMVDGSVDSQQAFMAGKIKADNMTVLMKFATVFDMKRAAKEAAKKKGGDSDANPLDTVFERMPDAFLPDRAKDMAADIHFDLGGEASYTITIRDQACSTAPGAPENPDCTITYDSAQTFLDIAAGKADAQQSFMAGKIKSDNMTVLMKFATVFDMKKAAEMRKAQAAGNAEAAPASEGLNEACIGKTYRAEARLITKEASVAYAEASTDPNEAFSAGEAVPVLYPVAPFMDVIGQAVLNKELNADLLRLVHGEQDMRFHRVLKPGDLVAPRASIHSIEKKSSGELLEVRQRLMFEGEVACDTISGYFIRAPKKPGEASAKKERKPTEEPPGDPVLTQTVTVGERQPIEYAGASGDNNPIHVDDATAKAAGHPGIILHGLCTMAFVGQAVVEDYLGGDYGRLKRLAVRFAKPVLPGDTLTTQAWLKDSENGVQTLSILTTNQNGDPVITRALAEVREN
ncbi:MAG: SDR family NAD(P)-dependent oxidoreductase [Myxococcota bacterium]|nr:SDR family NAD(P)-dependent oxidoreductase [Myxococcota bacterium]